MSYSDNKKLQKVYAATNDAERKGAYDNWASDYDKDVSQFGIRLPFVAAVMIARHVDAARGPFLDAACGTGMHIEPLALAGYQGITGVDISNGMLAEAKRKNIYENLHQMSLTKRLGFPDNSFEASFCIGALAPGHVPPEAMDELIRVTKSQGYVIVSMHAQNAEEAQLYHVHRTKLSGGNAWKLVDATEPFISMPHGDQSIQHAVYVYRVT